MAVRRLAVSVASTWDDVAAVRDLLPVAAAGLAFSRTTLLRLEICLGEALHNVVRHSYAGRSDGAIDVSFDATVERLVVEISDRGKPMPESAQTKIRTAPPIADRDGMPVTDLPEGGFGIPILRTVLDHVEYRREGDRNVLTLVKKASSSCPEVAAPSP